MCANFISVSLDGKKSGRMPQFADVVCTFAGTLGMFYSQSNMAQAIEYITERCVVHRVGIARWHLLEIDFEFFGGPGRLLQVAGQAEEARIEDGGIGLQDCRIVALGIDCDENDLQAIAVGTKQLLDLRCTCQCGRTDVGALREAEEDQHDLAAEITQRARISVGIIELKIARISGAGDVEAVKTDRCGLMTSGNQQADCA